MSATPLVTILLLLFFALLGLMLTIWFLLTLSTGNAQRQEKTQKQPKKQRVKHAEKVAPPRQKQTTTRAPVVNPRTPSATPVTPAPPAPVRARTRTVRLNDEPLSNDQIRGVKAQSRRQDKKQQRTNDTEDAFERFIHSKNDDLNF